MKDWDDLQYRPVRTGLLLLLAVAAALALIVFACWFDTAMVTR